ncbi:4'-phosphopantetheinyl transferase superfamily protein [Ferruginibacter paludis]|uniref:4'-phosphopantetheinyl transferase family protein n=1 Tax=Ferruginibacter paludis TaxID=1310417 RepID=UPI0025B619A6|nr:4'-phosphopantetheinyl transferase superfamily protein [Ferruginibacter paludis]MDN3658648.1 4'-phosphopantetheinyl transferase superfamily protein [Ferruginibacter paludis]
MDKLQWSRVITKELISLNLNEVHVWRVDLDITPLSKNRLLGLLSTDERERAGRFRFERDQKRFIAARGMLRQILGYYLGIPPQELRFKYTSHGKPFLVTNAGYDTLQFNLSHSDAVALLAITPDRDIGIDIERIRCDVAVGQIANSFFSSNEIISLERIDDDQRSGVFFQYWTRKEAILKAVGEGVLARMQQFDVSLISERVLLPHVLAGDKRESSDWHVQDLCPGRGYVAAIAVEGSDCDLSCWQYSEGGLITGFAGQFDSQCAEIRG